VEAPAQDVAEPALPAVKPAAVVAKPVMSPKAKEPKTPEYPDPSVAPKGPPRPPPASPLVSEEDLPCSELFF
jgi:hypothetical protein